MIDTLPYVPPYGTPLYWGNEQSGQLPAAVVAFLAEATGDGTCSEEQRRLVVEYLRYVIGAPCWQGEQIESLRERATHLQATQDIQQWIMDCLNEGIDPL